MIEGKQALLKRAAQAGHYPRKAASSVCMSSGGSLSNSIHAPVTGCSSPASRRVHSGG
jgi:hypothetical protein